MTKKACDGAPTKYIRKGGEHWEECRECKTRIVCDMVNHWFFGFQNCDKKTEPAKAIGVEVGT